MNKNINVADLITDIEQQLLTVYDDPVLCRQYAWWTVQSIVKMSKATLIARGEISFSDHQSTELAQWLEKLIVQKMPIQYLIGSVPFCDGDILVAPPILIPRPETEEWCSNLIERLKQLDNKKIMILDLCCGSGCIAIALAKALSQAVIYAADISSDAVVLTKKNVVRNGLTNVVVLESDLFVDIPASVKFDLVVTNPPYISEDEWRNLDASVRDWEDKKALCASDEGLAIIKKIIDQAPSYIAENQELCESNIPQLTIEIGYQQGAVVCALMRHANYMHVKIEKDLEGKDRVVSGSLHKNS